ncbi:MAG: HU family DNA-binding protein [Acidobacteria bacterium]|nr:HU family DNA-binding protein [Acidobacteriota bacterium]
MNKGDLIKKMATDAEIKQVQAAKAFSAMIDGIAEALKTGDRVTLVGFGTFKVATRKARTGLNPQTKKKMNIPARKVPKFTPGKGLKDKI